MGSTASTPQQQQLQASTTSWWIWAIVIIVIVIIVIVIIIVAAVYYTKKKKKKKVYNGIPVSPTPVTKADSWISQGNYEVNFLTGERRKIEPEQHKKNLQHKGEQ